MHYPLRFQPIFKSMLWGGSRLPAYVRSEYTSTDPVGEAWMLSDVPGNHSVVANGPLAGQTLQEIIARNPDDIYGDRHPHSPGFPLLCKFIDARHELSVQVHPTDALARQLKGEGHRGKTEAWVILDRDPTSSLLYAGFKPGVTPDSFREAMRNRTTHETLHSFTPEPGDCLFLEAGTVHAIGAHNLIFEVQQTSDITYRLYDWDRIDKKTGQSRELHIEPGLICSDFSKGPCHPVKPKVDGQREILVDSPYFKLIRQTGDKPMSLGDGRECRVVACVAGYGTLGSEPIQTGDVYLLPANIASIQLTPTEPMTILECGLGPQS